MFHLFQNNLIINLYKSFKKIKKKKEEEEVNLRHMYKSIPWVVPLRRIFTVCQWYLARAY